MDFKNILKRKRRFDATKETLHNLVTVINRVDSACDGEVRFTAENCGVTCLLSPEEKHELMCVLDMIHARLTSQQKQDEQVLSAIDLMLREGN